MRKRDELADPNSCLGKAEDGEWLFVLLERDAAAPAAVRAWIGERLRLGKNARLDPQVLDAERWLKMVEARTGRRGPPGPPETLEDATGRMLADALARCGGKKRAAAAELGICPKRFRAMLKRGTDAGTVPLPKPQE